MDRLGIEFISAMGMPPGDFVRLAADLGVSQVSLSPRPITDNPHGYPTWDLTTDPALVRRTKAALEANSVRLGQAEGFLIMPGMEIADNEAMLDIMVELSAPAVNSVAIEPDRARALDQFALLAQMAEKRGILAMVEFMPMMVAPGNITEALEFVAESGAANGRVLIDAMHFYRSGSDTAELATIDQSRIGYIQLCDVPMQQATGEPSEAAMMAYGEEARHGRLCPGDGNLPLGDFLAALPRDLTVGLEVPMLEKAKAGISPEEVLRPCVEAARKLLAGLD
ncbi:MAG: TIM barrel protein [Novosphingobium sp.]|nr:TIM barrel protein [Novosphingobium sp.]